MRLSEVSSFLSSRSAYTIHLPTGEAVPAHFHVTEIGLTQKSFIDCGGTPRQERRVTFQLWNADDYDHRLHPDKLIKIIDLAKRQLNLEDDEVQVEFQGAQTIELYGLTVEGDRLVLTSKATDCLAKEQCGLPEKVVDMKNLVTTSAGCTPGGGCC